METQANILDRFDPRFESVQTPNAEPVILSDEQFNQEYDRLCDLVLSLRALGFAPVENINEELNQPFIQVDGMNIYCKDEGFIEFPLNRKFASARDWVALKNHRLVVV